MAVQDVATHTFDNTEIVPVVEKTAFAFNVKLKASTTYAKGTVLGPITATPGLYGPYASGNSDGTQVAECVLTRACVTDASSLVTQGTSAGNGEWGATLTQVPAYFGGVFDVSQLTTGDASYTTGLKARLIKNATLVSF